MMLPGGYGKLCRSRCDKTDVKAFIAVTLSPCATRRLARLSVQLTVVGLFAHLSTQLTVQGTLRLILCCYPLAYHLLSSFSLSLKPQKLPALFASPPRFASAPVRIHKYPPAPGEPVATPLTS